MKGMALLVTLVAAAWMGSGAPVVAAELPALARTEILQLLGRLQHSGCRFNRNGNWYEADAAREHLLKKLDYLTGKGAVTTTEQFIEYAASRSSMTSRPYRVQCFGADPMDSGPWLKAQLQQLRAQR